jgi:cobalt/nickel transport system ATP-binding protein
MKDDFLIKVENLSYTYPDGQRALERLNFALRKGESVGIIGPNGAGKSTFLLNLNGILKGDGEVIVAGITLSKNSRGGLREVRRKVGLVFQDPDDQLFMPTVYDDVAFGPLNLGLPVEELEERVGQALAAVGLSGYEGRFSHHLSLGEKKRVSLATVLSMNPEILVLDEPTSNLDPKARRQLVKILNSLNHTKIIATHDLDFSLETTERTVLFYQGRIVADGPTKEILSNETLLRQYDL